MLEMFERNVKEMADQPFLGTRPMLEAKDARGKPMYGPYEW